MAEKKQYIVIVKVGEHESAVHFELADGEEGAAQQAISGHPIADIAREMVISVYALGDPIMEYVLEDPSEPLIQVTSDYAGETGQD